jgi:N-acetylglucosamine-6-phosphate deacetylase
MNKRLRIFNGQVLLPDKNLGLGTVIIEDGKIIGVEKGTIAVDNADDYDAKGCFIAPGFIDMHTHGAGGHDFMDCTEEACYGISEMHAKHGTTLLFPTTLASNNEELFKFLDVYDKVKNNVKGARFGGLHLEGPYFAYAFRGAQDPKYLRNPNPNEYMEILSRSKDIKRWSIAPELPGALDFGKTLVQHGILPSIAHTDAIYQEVVKAYEVGYTLITHFYSCMNGIVRRNAYRYAGCIEAGYLIDNMDIEIIGDGIHAPTPLLQLALKVKDSDRIALITDSMRAAGMPEGKSILGSLTKGQEVIVEDGVAKMPDRQSFAGSVATTDRLVRTLKDVPGCSLVKAVKMASLVPARIMGISDHKGKIAKGYDADIVIFDEHINMKQIIINGIKKSYNENN